MPNNSSLPYPIPSFFASRKIFVGFSPKVAAADSETSMSPTSTLETKQFSKSPPPAVGLGQLVDIVHSDTKSNNKCFIFGSQLKIQVPSVQPYSSLPSPIEFGIKTKDSQLALHSPLSSDARRPTVISSFTPELLTDLELSEEYTCVISHGPNPKTTHIFDDCVVQESPADGALSFCHACEKNLSQGKDIFMYRGEKAFCSKECRRREMMGLRCEGEPEFSQHLSDLV